MKLKIYREGKTKELEDFVNRMEITEPFDYDAPFIFYGKLNGQLVFINVFRLEKVEDKIVPRFIHILIDESVRGSKLIVDLLKQAEGYLKLLEYKETFAYIDNANRKMSVLAKKFGYIPKTNDGKSTYFFKKIGE